MSDPNETSNELVLSNMTNMVDFYSGHYDQVEQDEINEDLNPDKMVPMLKLSRETGDFNLMMGDVALELPSKKRVYFVIATRTGSRNLWSPQSDTENKQPICSTGNVSVKHLKAVDCVGHFGINERYPQPYRLYDDENNELHVAVGESQTFLCERCPYNSFGSMAAWDTSRNASRGKACGETRTYYVMPVTKLGLMRDIIKRANPEADVRSIDEEFGLFGLDNKLESSMNKAGMMRLNLSMGSNRKASEAIAMEIHAHSSGGMKVPFSAAVFQGTIELVEKGAVKLAILNPKMVGLLDPKSLGRLENELRSEVNDFIVKTRRYVSADTKDEMGF
jgi:hypothetical protein